MKALRHALCAACLAATPLLAQDPVTLPGMRVTDSTMKPGPKRIVGIVVDTLGRPVPGAEVTIPSLARRLLSNDEGTFFFGDVPKGKYSMRARKLGFAPQVREFKVDADGGEARFALVPLARALPPVVSASTRGGLSGVVGDMSHQSISGALVKVLGNRWETQTDASGSFFMPVEPGRYMVSITKEGFATRIVGVRIPSDSGRDILAWLQPGGKVPKDQFWNIKDLGDRMAWIPPHERVVFTREDLARLKIEWIYDAVSTTTSRFQFRDSYSRDCMVVVNGGPGVASLATLTIDDVETVEVYRGLSGAPASTQLTRKGELMSTIKAPHVNFDNTRKAAHDNRTRICPGVFVWLR